MEMINFYKLLDIKNSASIQEIIIAYEKKINVFNGIDKLNEDNITMIKLLKSALYILTNHNLRDKYDLQFKNSPIENVPSPGNMMEDDNMESLFNVDTSWMKKHDTNEKKPRIDSNLFSDRIFGMTEFNKKPLHPSDYELRNPMQGREDKTKVNE